MVSKFVTQSIEKIRNHCYRLTFYTETLEKLKLGFSKESSVICKNYVHHMHINDFVMNLLVSGDKSLTVEIDKSVCACRENNVRCLA